MWPSFDYSLTLYYSIHLGGMYFCCIFCIFYNLCHETYTIYTQASLKSIETLKLLTVKLFLISVLQEYILYICRKIEIYRHSCWPELLLLCLFSEVVVGENVNMDVLCIYLIVFQDVNKNVVFLFHSRVLFVNVKKNLHTCICARHY